MKNLKNEQGAALVATLMFLMAMGILSTALVFTVNNEMMTSAAYKYSEQAFYVANSGINKTLDWFRNDVSNPNAAKYVPSLAAGYDLTTLPPRLSVSGTLSPVMFAGQTGYTSNYPNATMSNLFATNFSQAVEASRMVGDTTRNFGNFGVNATLLSFRNVSFWTLDTSTNPPKLNINPTPWSIERWRLDSVGYWASTASPLGMARVSATIENEGEAFFDRALWGKDLVDMGGTSFVDSFDPNKGAWDENSNHGELGAIGSNGRIEQSNNTWIYGDAAYGPTGTADLNPDKVTGNIIQLSSPRTFPDIADFNVDNGNVSWEDETVSGGTYGKVYIDGDVRLNPGTYFMNTLTIKSQGNMIITGDTTIYIKNDFSMLGQATSNSNPPDAPKNVTIWYPGDRELKWAGGTNISASIYAPNAKLTLTGGSEYSGSFIGKEVRTIGNTKVHFDQGSLSRNQLPRPFRIITWVQATNTP
jgi:hypothetical protein